MTTAAGEASSISPAADQSIRSKQDFLSSPCHLFPSWTPWNDFCGSADTLERLCRHFLATTEPRRHPGHSDTQHDGSPQPFPPSPPGERFCVASTPPGQTCREHPEGEKAGGRPLGPGGGTAGELPPPEGERRRGAAAESRPSLPSPRRPSHERGGRLGRGGGCRRG